MYGRPRFEFWHCPQAWQGYQKGGSSSSSSTSNSTETIQMDNRMVNDGGTALTATNSTVNQSVVNNTVNTDASIALDAMSKMQTTAAAAMAAAAAAADGASAAAAAANKGALDFASTNSKGVFDFGQTSAGMAYKTIGDALGFAEKTLQLGGSWVRENQDLIGKTQTSVGDAYKTAAQVNNGQQVLIIAGLLVAGVVAVRALK